LLAAVFTGVMISVAIFWTFNLKNTFTRWKLNLQKSRGESKLRRIEGLFNKSENFFLNGRLEKALSLIDKVLDASPNHIQALSLKGKILFSRGEKVLATNIQKKVLELDPASISVLFDLATTYEQTGQIKDEINLLKKVHRDNPKAVRPLVRLRDAFSKQQDWKNILIAQDKILPLIRDNKEEWDEEVENKSHFLFARGKQNWEQDKRDPAISDFKQALKAWKKNSDAHLFLGDIYLEIGKPKIALKKWFAGFEETRNIACLIRAQKVYLKIEDPQALIEIYKKAIDPNQPQANYKYVLLLVVLYLEHEQVEKAKNILEENQTENELLYSLLLDYVNKPSNNGSDLGSNFNLIREAVFQFPVSDGSNLQ
jgi:tetratricopeptide (TPR) repeat protein